MKRIFFLIVMMAMLASVLIFQGCVKNPELPGPVVHSAPDSAISLDALNFDSLVLNSGKVAVVEFYSAHCSVCGPMMWVIDSLAKTMGDSALVGAVNTDTDDTLWKRFSVGTVPTYLFFNNRALVARRSYLSPDSTAYDTLLALLRQVVAANRVIDTADTSRPPDSSHTVPVMLNASNFDSLVMDSGVVALVEFHPAACSVCTEAMWIMDSLVSALGNSALVGLVNMDTDSALSKRFSVSDYPKYLLFKDGVLMVKEGYFGADSFAYDTLLSLVHGLIVKHGGPVMLDKTNFAAKTAVPGLVAMVEFFSPGCGACQMMQGVVDSLAERYTGAALIAKVNVLIDDTLQFAYNVQWWPTFVFLKDGAEVRRIVGVQPQDTLAAAIDSLLVSTPVP